MGRRELYSVAREWRRGDLLRNQSLESGALSSSRTGCDIGQDWLKMGATFFPVPSPGRSLLGTGCHLHLLLSQFGVSSLGSCP